MTLSEQEIGGAIPKMGRFALGSVLSASWLIDVFQLARARNPVKMP